ncbi:hypothetical protein QO002_005719 [Pararhizobium capsulatum DSM 1112]|uniref:Uncharacterized protein n=1 Tax=Pararhizobium capsulatum DSM 1112 TaxID=1121113 RepID=A0ABU0BZZ5_9HYPH|nr:hypothetical protein [Pararhizobium capsulatum DSM 1112]
MNVHIYKRSSGDIVGEGAELWRISKMNSGRFAVPREFSRKRTARPVVVAISPDRPGTGHDRRKGTVSPGSRSIRKPTVPSTNHQRTGLTRQTRRFVIAGTAGHGAPGICPAGDGVLRTTGYTHNNSGEASGCLAGRKSEDPNVKAPDEPIQAHSLRAQSSLRDPHNDYVAVGRKCAMIINR